ncbi:MAG: PHP domain-containing protein [Candidatus Thermoplasmatota archaeon]|nr:PHP domain-containing protein [Candidatus Thermoplasmatota archaeon]
MPRVDLHSHSFYSPDSRMRFEGIADACQAAGIDVVATTDHHTADGALAFQRWAGKHRSDLHVIVGEEVMTDQGEVIGLYLNETIPSPCTLGEALDAIRDQGGLFLLEHPFDPLRHGLDALSWEVDPDIIEVFNARTRLKGANAKALELAEAKGTPVCACSDAHTYGEFGAAYTDVPAFDPSEPKQLLDALGQGTLHETTSPPWVSVHSTVAKLLHKVGL